MPPTHDCNFATRRGTEIGQLLESNLRRMDIIHAGYDWALAPLWGKDKRPA